MTREERAVALDALRWRELEDSARDWRTWATSALAVAGMFAALRLAALFVAGM